MIINQTVSGGGNSEPTFTQIHDNGTSFGKSNTFLDLTGMTQIEPYGLACAYAKTSMSSGDLLTGSIVIPSSIQYLYDGSFYKAFFNQTDITSVDLSNIEDDSQAISVYDSAFEGCTSLTTVHMPNVSGGYYDCGEYGKYRRMCYGCESLTTIDGNFSDLGGTLCSAEEAFVGCAFSSIDVSAMSSISEKAMRKAFEGCASLTSLSFDGLANIDANGCEEMCKDCTSLTTISFGVLDFYSSPSDQGQFHNMLDGCENVTVHFPSALQSAISSWPDVVAGFGGTNTTVLFDL